MTTSKPISDSSVCSGEQPDAEQLDADALIPQLYNELRKLAKRRIEQLRPGRTLQPTELVHELYEKFANKRDKAWESPTHFYRAAARAMNYILIDYGRARNAKRRGGDQQQVDISITILENKPPLPLDRWLELYQALEHMLTLHPDHAELVLYRYFVGLSMQQIADMQEVSLATVQRRWRFARAWLSANLRAHQTDVPATNDNGPATSTKHPPTMNATKPIRKRSLTQQQGGSRENVHPTSQGARRTPQTENPATQSEHHSTQIALGRTLPS